MKKFIIAILLGVAFGLMFSPSFVEAVEDYQAQIKSLEKQVADKQAIIMEQIKVITMMKDNFKANYPNFDLKKYPQTDGFPTEWLEGERVKILETCKEALAMGYENPYCKFVK